MCQSDTLHVFCGCIIPYILCLLSYMENGCPLFTVYGYFKISISQVIELCLDNIVTQG